uniref:Claudin n=1 Tax=Arion vulgaris TaxID=1028688 RepID=A0A0B6YDK8_9EUPU
MGYGTGQRIAFAGLVIGILLCMSGAIAPFWQEGSMSVNTLTQIFGEKIPFIGDIKVAKLYGGLWWYCVEILGEKKCDVYDFSDSQSASGWAVRIACVLNVALTLMCALVALCRTCCCAGGKTIFHGIITFIAGGLGIATVAIFAVTVSDGYGMKLNLVNYGWAFYVYAAGAAVVTFVSFLLCFASPDNPLTPVIISSMNHMLPNKRYTQMADEHVLIEDSRNNPYSHNMPNVGYVQVQSY